jgi:hypothetical protein
VYINKNVFFSDDIRHLEIGDWLDKGQLSIIALVGNDSPDIILEDFLK